MGTKQPQSPPEGVRPEPTAAPPPHRQPGVNPPEPVGTRPEPTVVPPSQLSIVEHLERSEIEVLVDTAHRYPRSITQCRQRVHDMACADERTAAACTYAVPRAGKNITGPSICMAEIVASAWTNLRVANRIIDVGDKHVRAQGIAYDTEQNIVWSKEVMRRITDRNGKRFSDDMIAVTCAAAAAIAVRNALFSCIPRAVWWPVWEEIKGVARGDEKTLGARRKQMIEWFAGKGVNEKQLLQLIGKAGLADIEIDDVVTMREIANGIEEGTQTVEGLLAHAKITPTTANMNDEQLTESLTATPPDTAVEPGAASAEPNQAPPPPDTALPSAPAPPHPDAEELTMLRSRLFKLYAQVANTVSAEAANTAIAEGGLGGTDEVRETDDVQLLKGAISALEFLAKKKPG